MNVIDHDTELADVERRLRAACAATIPRLMRDDEPGDATRSGEAGRDTEPIDAEPIDTEPVGAAGRPGWWMTAAAVVLVICAIGLVAQQRSTGPAPAAISVPSADSAAIPATVGPPPPPDSSATTEPPVEVPFTSTGPPCTTPGCARGVTVMIANANGVGGAAAALTASLPSGPGGFLFVEATDASEDVGVLDTTVIYYDRSQPDAVAVATALDQAMGGGITVLPLDGTPPVAGGELHGAGVLVLLGRDRADLTAPTG